MGGYTDRLSGQVAQTGNPQLKFARYNRYAADVTDLIDKSGNGAADGLFQGYGSAEVIDGDGNKKSESVPLLAWLIYDPVKLWDHIRTGFKGFFSGNFSDIVPLEGNWTDRIENPVREKPAPAAPAQPAGEEKAVVPAAAAPAEVAALETAYTRCSSCV